MMTGIRLRKPLWVTFMALMVAVTASDSRAQGGVADIGKAITAEFASLPNSTVGKPVSPSFQIAGMTFFAHSSPAGNPAIVDWNPPGAPSYRFNDAGVTVVLPLEARAVEVRLCPFAGAVLVETWSSTGTLVAQKRARFSNTCDDLSLKGDSSSDLISIVRFTGGDNGALIVRLSAILNSALVVNAGADQSVVAGALVILSGTADGTIASYAWQQTGGTGVSLSGADGAIAMFTAPHPHLGAEVPAICIPSGPVNTDCQAPDLPAEETLTFRLTVTDDDGETASDEVRVVVRADAGQGIDRFTAVSAGGWHTCSLRDTGTVACWGWDYSGQSTPPAGTFTALSAGGWHTCGLRDTGVVACWGWDYFGQSTPPAGTFTALSAGVRHTCGLRDTGAVECWGNNDAGQSTPPAGTFTAVSAGGLHACGLRDTGAVECWGDNDEGQSTPPTGTFTAVSAGVRHTCGLRNTGAVECWGDNDEGQSTPLTGTFTAVSIGVGLHLRPA